MAGIIQVSVISTWSIMYILFLWIYSFLPGGNTLVPVATIEKGFVPSSTWLGETSNVSLVQKETQQHEQKENIQTAYQNHYLQYPSPQLPSPVNPWAPATPSTLTPPSHHNSVVVTIQQPEALILLCQVQEPLEHISWLRYPCPNQYAASDGTLIADGTVVFNASLYGVRITGENGVFLSELRILHNSLQPDVAGLYRCEAWAHGANRDIASHQTSSRYKDEFIIGGHSMLKSCFYDPHRDKYYYQHYGPTSYNYKLQKTYRTPRNKIVPDVSNSMAHNYSKTNKTDVS